MPLRDRIKAKFGKKDASTPQRVEASPTPYAPVASDPALSPPSLPARLWNQAYGQVKTGDSSTVEAYEKILSDRLSEQDVDASTLPHLKDFASQQNEIAPDVNRRQIQMLQLVQDGLRRTEKDTKAKQKMGVGIQAVTAVKEVVDKAIQASPEAAIAWVGVCFALEILMNPLTQASANRQGIAYVVSKMDWYWNLSSLLLDENMTKAHSPGLRDELEKVVTRLYAKLLLYQMKSACYYHRGRLSVFARDLIKLDNWDGELSDIKAAEAAVQADSAQYNTLSIRVELGAIAEAAQSQNAKLDSISSAIREQTKQQERMYETSADNKCLADLRLTDPRDDKKRIEETKGGLLKESFYWILDNSDFRQWCCDPQNPLLWVKADPGKGKTMLLCGIIDEFQKSTSATGFVSYFFCQATDSRIRSAVAVLRGLLYLLVCQQPSLISHVRKEYDHVGKVLFEDANAWIALAKIFTNILQDPSLKCAYMIVDALDECITDLPKLLDLIVKESSTSRVKWIVSSRNWPDIEEELGKTKRTVRLSLELNAQSVSSAVSSFIRHKVYQLAKSKMYDDRTRDDVLDHLASNANDTFLWVALVCQSLERVPRRKAREKLEAFPPGLDSLYERMMQQISNSEDAQLCKQILALVGMAYQPPTLDELITLVEELEDVADDLQSIREIIGICGSFLTLREDTVCFVHQSAKEFLTTKASHDIFPLGEGDTHRVIFSRSLQAMSTLHRDMYSLAKLGYPAEQIVQPNPDPLAALRYSCIYWIDHLCDWKPRTSADSALYLQDGGTIHKFVTNKYLYWLEALSLYKSITVGVISIARLEALVQGRADAAALVQLVQDARRFVLYHMRAIESSPLQAYASALLFSPRKSLVRRLFQHEEPDWINVKPAMIDNWSACLQTLEGHSHFVMSVAFSHNSTRLASASRDNTVKVWDTSSSACLQTLEGHSDLINSVAFSHDSTRLTSASWDSTVKIWDASSGACLQTLIGHSGSVKSVAFSHNSTQLASASSDTTIKLWDASSGACLQTLYGHSSSITSVAFSHNSTQLASASNDDTIKIWDVSSGACLQTLDGHSSPVTSVAFSHNSTQLASASDDRTIKIWDASSGACLQTLEGHSSPVTSVAFSYDSTRLASASWDSTVKIWDLSSGACLQTLEGHGDLVSSVAFSHDSTWLASTSYDKTIKIWDASGGAHLQMSEGHNNLIISVVFSHDSTHLASASLDGIIKIWNTTSGACLQTLKGHSSSIKSVAFSHDSTRLASCSDDKIVKLWDINSGACLQTLADNDGLVYSAVFSYDSTRLAFWSDGVSLKIWDTTRAACLQTLEYYNSFEKSVVFSHDSTQLASASSGSTVKIWDASNGACLQTLKGHSNSITSVAFSHDSTWLASTSYDKTIKIWDTSSGVCLQTLIGHSDSMNAVTFSHDSTQLASASDDRTIKIWDASSGVCLQTLDVVKPISSIAFDPTGSCLHTDIGPIVISVLRSLSATDMRSSQYQGGVVGIDGAWITFNSEKLLWVPSEYRPYCSAVLGKTIGIGVASGKLWICGFDINEPKKVCE